MGADQPATERPKRETFYDFEVEKILGEVKASQAKRVLIQAPDGLKQYLLELCRRLAEAGVTPIVSADPCYGACDLAEDKAALLKADLLIHIGHLRFRPVAERVKTLYVPAKHLVDISRVSELVCSFLKSKGVRRVGVVAGTQHLGHIGEFSEALRRCGVDTVVDGKSGGLVLGCRVEAAKRVEGEVEAFIYLGGGDFHGLGVAMAVEKEVYVADPYRGEVRGLGGLKKKFLAKRWWAIMEATKAKTFGIVLVTKSGQLSEPAAASLKRELERRGRGALLIAAEEVNWERLTPLAFIDAFIVTGCPRIALDNPDNFGRPVLNESDALELLGRVQAL